MSATDKWLQDMSTLKNNTDTLRAELSNGGVAVSNTETLGQLIAKVPQLSPIEYENAWKPDPLWKFPDPNGSQTTKTIREIYDEDTTTGYTYKAIFQIRGDIDTFDIKACFVGSVTYTFKLSDGTTYTDVSATSLVHTWDTTKDVVDSNGVPMRYIFVYTNTNNESTTVMPGIYGQLVWVIWNLTNYFPTQNTISSVSGTLSNNAQNTYKCKYVQCVELECNTGTPSGYVSTTLSRNVIGAPQKIVIKKIYNYNTSNTLYLSADTSTREVDIYDIQRGIVSSFPSPTLESLKIRHVSNNEGFPAILMNASGTAYFSGNTTSTSGQSMTSLSTMPAFNLKYLDLSGLTSTTTLNASSPSSTAYLETFILPPNLIQFYRRDFYNLKTLNIPSSVTLFYMGVTFMVDTIIFNSVPTTYSWGANYFYCRKFIIPLNWDITLPNFTNCTLDHDAIVDMFDNLADLTGQTAKSISLGTYNLSLLTTAEKEIATNKNWTLS